MKKDSDIPRMCEFCRFASEIKAMGDMLCMHRGVVDKAYVCRKFVYDPLKRIPRPLPEMPVFDEDV